jgi:hypothetical protein
MYLTDEQYRILKILVKYVLLKRYQTGSESNSLITPPIFHRFKFDFKIYQLYSFKSLFISYGYIV